MTEITQEYLDSLDKRTNIYKEAKKQFDEQNEITGLGDVVEKITEATGIKKLVKWIAGEDCGCDQRKDALNKLFPLRKTPNCLSENDYKWLREWYQSNRSRMKVTEQKELLNIYNSVFGTKHEINNCGDCYTTKLNELRIIYNEYENENIKA